MQRRGSPEKLTEARRMRRQPTSAERRVWNLIRNRQIQGLKFPRQAVVRGFIVDFYCADRKLILELDGEVHDDQKDYDLARDERLRVLGYRVIRLSNQDADRLTIEGLISPRPKGRGAGGEGKEKAARIILLPMNLTFLGTSAACPTVERNTAGLAVQREGETLIFDCGEGTQRQMMRWSVGFSFREIFFTHYHSDHFLGVIGLIRTMGLMDRSEPLTLYGPKGAQRVLGGALGIGIERNKFPVEIVEVKPGDVLKREEYDIRIFETDHRTDTVGYALAEHRRLGRFNPDKARELGIPEGPLWGRLHKGEPIELPGGRRVSPADLVGLPRPGRTLVYTGDTRPFPAVVEAARGADLLVHEATFSDSEIDRAKETGHSTAREAAEIAREAGVRRLVLTHISPRYSVDVAELLKEAQAIFPETAIARDGWTVEVPFVE